MANEQNLKPFDSLTEKEQREIRSKGGKKSAEVRRQKKTMQEIAKYILSMSLQKGEKHSIEQIQNLAEIKGKNISVNEAILLKQVEKALKGDLNSAAFVRDTSGETITNRLQIAEPPKIVDDV